MFCPVLFNREPNKTGLVHPVAHLWIWKRKHSSVPARSQSVDSFSALPKPQSPIQVQPAHVPQSASPGARFLRRSTYCWQPSDRTLPFLGLWSPFSATITTPKAFWSHTSSDSFSGQHHDSTRDSPYETKEQSEGPWNTTTSKPEAHLSAAWVHCVASEQIPWVPVGKPLGWVTDTKVSVAVLCNLNKLWFLLWNCVFPRHS